MGRLRNLFSRNSYITELAKNLSVNSGEQERRLWNFINQNVFLQEHNYFWLADAPPLTDTQKWVFYARRQVLLADERVYTESSLMQTILEGVLPKLLKKAYENEPVELLSWVCWYQSLFGRDEDQTDAYMKEVFELRKLVGAAMPIVDFVDHADDYLCSKGYFMRNIK